MLVLVGLRACYRTPESPRAERNGLAVLLLLALLGCLQRAGTVTGPLPEMQLHLWARSTPTVLPHSFEWAVAVA